MKTSRIKRPGIVTFIIYFALTRSRRSIECIKLKIIICRSSVSSMDRIRFEIRLHRRWERVSFIVQPLAGSSPVTVTIVDKSKTLAFQREDSEDTACFAFAFATFAHCYRLHARIHLCGHLARSRFIGCCGQSSARKVKKKKKRKKETNERFARDSLKEWKGDRARTFQRHCPENEFTEIQFGPRSYRNELFTGIIIYFDLRGSLDSQLEDLDTGFNRNSVSSRDFGVSSVIEER